MLIAGKHAVRQAVILVEFGDHLSGGFAIGLGAGHERPDGAGLHGLPIVHAVRGKREILEATAFIELDELGGDLLLVLEVRVLRHPVVALLMQKPREVEQVRGAGAVVEPDHAQQLILPAEFAPVAQRAFGKLGELIAEVAVHERNDARVAGEFLILREGFQRDDARPPVVVRGGTDHAVGGLVGEYPVDVLLRFGFESRIVEQPGKRNQAVEVVRSALPRLAGSTKPAAVGADVWPGLVEVAAESIGLDLKLAAQPTSRLDLRERQWIEGAWCERRPILTGSGICRLGQSEELVRLKCAGESGETGLLKEAATCGARSLRHGNLIATVNRVIDGRRR